MLSQLRKIKLATRKVKTNASKTLNLIPNNLYFNHTKTNIYKIQLINATKAPTVPHIAPIIKPFTNQLSFERGVLKKSIIQINY